MAGPEVAQEEREAELLALAKRLLRSVSKGALATLDGEGFPFATLVTVASDYDGAPILLTSALSAHSRNMRDDPRGALLLAQEGKGDPLAHPRLTVSGTVVRADEPLRGRLRARFLARHPKATLYVDFADFLFWRLEPASAHLNGGFAKAARFDAAALLTDTRGANALIAAEAAALEHLNADHADALDLYARIYGGKRRAGWRAYALDPDGLDLRGPDGEMRIAFPQRLLDPEGLRETLSDLANRARAARACE